MILKFWSRVLQSSTLNSLSYIRYPASISVRFSSIFFDLFRPDSKVIANSFFPLKRKSIHIKVAKHFSKTDAFASELLKKWRKVFSLFRTVVAPQREVGKIKRWNLEKVKYISVFFENWSQHSVLKPFEYGRLLWKRRSELYTWRL